jgi:hypothetical protein
MRLYGEGQQRPSRHLVDASEGEFGFRRGVWNIGIGQQRPAFATFKLRECEADQPFIAVHDDEYGLVLGATLDSGLLSPAIKQHPEAFHRRIFPVCVLHFMAIGVDPGHVLDVESLVVLTGEETAAVQRRIRLA